MERKKKICIIPGCKSHLEKENYVSLHIKILWNRMQALETKSLEPGRYNNRGGQLLKEEKERKTISTKLPKIEEHLKDLVHQYERKNNRKFTIYGDDILEIIEMQRVRKEKYMSARKNAGTPVHNKNLSVRTPISLRNPMGVALSSAKKFPFTPSTINGPSMLFSSKRKLPAKEAILPSSKRNLNEQFEVMPTLRLFKSPLKKLKPIIGSTIQKGLHV